LSILLQLVLPNANDVPPRSAQLPIDQQISFPVALNFGSPKSPVRFGLHITLGAAMPKTSIHEDSHFLLQKDEVGYANNRVVPPPTSNLVGSKQFYHRKFRALVSATPNLGHDLGSFGFGDGVSHLARL
jgi:hypothetical protein